MGQNLPVFHRQSSTQLSSYTGVLVIAAWG